MTHTSHRNALKADTELHWYRVEKVLGQGGFGITYLANNFNLQRKAAIKEYLPGDLAMRAGDNSVHPLTEENRKQFHWGLERFLSEARTLARFEHPNIVRVLDVFEENNTAYMVMSYEEGESLHDVLNRSKSLAEVQLMNVLMPILAGLELVHASGFIHRDIKPANIFLRRDGSPVLLDFGSARQALGAHTMTLTTLVSPGYAPFEQYHSKSNEQGPWTDIYGLGATLYRAVSGMPPMDALDRGRVILKGERDTFITAAELGKGRYSGRLLQAIDHALQFKEEDRPQTIAEWRREITGSGPSPVASKNGKKVAAERQTTVPAPGNVNQAAGAAAIVPESKRPSRPGRVPRSGRWAFMAIVLAVVVAMAWYSRAQLSDVVARFQKNRNVELLLQDARADMAAQRFVSPPDDNALLVLRTVLDLEPDNAEAILGLQNITDWLVEHARQAIAAENFSAAGEYLQEADGIVPGSPSVALARHELDRVKMEWERRQAEARAQREKLQTTLHTAHTAAGNGDVQSTLSYLDQAAALGAEDQALAGIKLRLRASLESQSADAAGEARAAIKAGDPARARAAIARAREHKSRAEALGIP